jgi:hypothetical protein
MTSVFFPSPSESILPNFASLYPLSPLSIAMAAASDTTQVSADKYLPHRPPSPTTSLATSLSPTLVDKSSYTEHPRPSLKLTIPIMIPGDSPYIINMVDFKVFNTPNWYKYYVFSSSNQTALFSCTDRVDVATVQWDRRPSPRMVFHRKKIKCKAWLPLTSTGPQKDSEYICPFTTSFRVESDGDPPPGLVRSLTAMQNSLGHRGGHPVMCVCSC